jgi:tetratricopeptide (TPR) repeat protein
MKSLVAVAIAALLAVPVFATGAPTDPQGKIPMDRMTVQELEKAGDAARTHKDYETAIEYFTAAIKKAPKNAHLYNKKGLAELKTNDMDSARLDFEKAAKIDKKYADAQNNVGAVYYIRKDYGKATKYFKKAIALDETQSSYHVNLGATWFAQKKMEQAMNEYARAMELNPNALEENSRAGITAQISSPEERAKYMYLMAKLYAKRGDTERCIQCLKSAKEQGYRDMKNVYKDEEFVKIVADPRLAEIVPPTPVAK